MTTTKMVKRKRGLCGRLSVEVDASQLALFNQITASIGMTKADAIAAALNIWLSMVISAKKAN